MTENFTILLRNTLLHKYQELDQVWLHSNVHSIEGNWPSEVGGLSYIWTRTKKIKGANWIMEVELRGSSADGCPDTREAAHSNCQVVQGNSTAWHCLSHMNKEESEPSHL